MIKIKGGREKMITEIYNDNYKIIESNTVFLFKSESDLILHFEISDDDEFEFDLRIVFQSNQERQYIKMVTEENEVRIVCGNFNNALGLGSPEPIEIATVNNKKMYIHIWSSLFGKPGNELKVRRVEYTVFLER